MQFQSQCSDNLEDGIKVRAPLTGECLVETLPAQTGFVRNPAHAMRLGNVAKRQEDLTKALPLVQDQRQGPGSPTTVLDAPLLRPLLSRWNTSEAPAKT